MPAKFDIHAVKYSVRIVGSAFQHRVHDAETNQWEVRISVQDPWSWYQHSELGHIFEPFYRQPKVVDAQIHGTGLGLAVAKRIAQANGGRLS